MQTYEYRHVVDARETDALGHVDYKHFFRWQGQCRQLFLRDHAPAILARMERDFALVTTDLDCDYFDDLVALEEVAIRMTLSTRDRTGLTMGFEYYRLKEGREELVAEGSQHVTCMIRNGSRMVPTQVPSELREALRSFALSPG
jgi:enediyne core biosynthesis thioesterase